MGLDTVTIGLILAILGFGIFVSFKILNITDLTVEASFTLGSAICIVFANYNMPVLGLLMGFIGGAGAGLITALLHTKLKLDAVLSGILTLTAFYSINLWVTNNIPTVNLSSNGSSIFLRQIDSPVNLIIALTIVIIIGIALFYFFKTKTGLSIRACGDNETMINTLCESVDKLKIIGLMLANGLVALSGALFMCFERYYDYTFGNGMMVIGVAAIIIGEALIPHKHKMIFMFLAIVIGSVAYRIIYALVLDLNNGNPNNMKLITSISIVLCILLASLRERLVKKHGKQNLVRN